MGRSIKGFDVSESLVHRTMAMKIRDIARTPTVTPTYRQGKIVSNEGGFPPSCTVQIGGTTVNVSGCRFMSPYNAVAGDLVNLVMLNGDIYVQGIQASFATDYVSTDIPAAQTVNGNKTWTGNLTIVDPSSAQHPASKVYTDTGVIIGGQGNATTDAFGSANQTFSNPYTHTTSIAPVVNAKTNFNYGMFASNISTQFTFSARNGAGATVNSTNISYTWTLRMI